MTDEQLKEAIRPHLEAMYLHSLEVNNLGDDTIDPPDPLEKAIELHMEPLLALVREAHKKAELYGRLHELIEWFQNGNISAEKYSERHADLTEQISALQPEKGTENNA